jgi:hypothetical protein
MEPGVCRTNNTLEARDGAWCVLLYGTSVAAAPVQEWSWCTQQLTSTLVFEPGCCMVMNTVITPCIYKKQCGGLAGALGGTTAGVHLTGVMLYFIHGDPGAGTRTRGPC